MSANISYETLMELHNLYLNGKHQVLSSKKEDTKSIWFELNEPMRKFLESVLNTPDISGLRMYFLQNPDTQRDVKGELIPTNKLEVDQLTVGLVATTITQAQNRDATAEGSNEDSLAVDPINHGTLCPPTCG